MFKLIGKNFSIIIAPFIFFVVLTAFCMAMYISNPSGIILLLMPSFYVSAVPVLGFWWEREHQNGSVNSSDYSGIKYAFARYITALIVEAVVAVSCMYALSYCQLKGYTDYDANMYAILGRMFLICPLATSAVLYPLFFTSKFWKNQGSGFRVFCILLVYLVLAGLCFLAINGRLDFDSRMYITTPTDSHHISKSELADYTYYGLILSAILYFASFLISSWIHDNREA